MPTATLSTKGQVVIPVSVRRAMGLQTGDVIVVDYDAATNEARLRRRESWDALAARFSPWIKPDTPLLESAADFYATRGAEL